MENETNHVTPSNKEEKAVTDNMVTTNVAPKNKHQEPNRKEELKPKKIGRITFGLTLILFGICIFLQTFLSLDMLRYVLMLWPLLFVSLGIETLYYSRKNEARFDVLSMFLVFIVLFVGIIFSTINYGVNKLIYNNDMKSDISRDVLDTNRTFYISGKLNIANLTGKKVNVNVVEDASYEDTVIKVKVNPKSDYKVSFWTLISDRYNISNIISMDYNRSRYSDEVDRNDRISYLTIIDYPEWADSIEVNIITSHKDNITVKEANS